MAALRMVALLAALAVLLPLSWAQQFTGTQMFTNYTGLSTDCQQALATNVTCSPYLGVVSETNGIVTADQIEDVCVDDCYSSLEAARSVITAACTLDTDIIVVENVAYPATFIVDNYLSRTSCHVEKTAPRVNTVIPSWPRGPISLSILASCAPTAG